MRWNYSNRHLLIIAVVMLGFDAPAVRSWAAPPPADAIPWEVTPDALAGPDASLKLKTNLAISPGFASDREILAPSRPSRFVLSLDSFFGGFELWDLVQGAKIRDGKGKLDVSDPVLSPDGQFIAGSRNAVLRIPPGVEIWSVKTGQLLRRIPSDDPSFASRAVGFVGNDRVVVHTRSGGGASIQVFTIVTGQKTAEWDAPLVVGKDDLRFSPTGRFVVLVSGTSLSFYDTGTGKAAGTIDLSALAEMQSLLRISPNYVAFAPAGDELAVLVGVGRDQHLLLISLKDHHLISSTSLDLDINSGIANQGLQYAPDGSSWLVNGRYVIDRSVMALVYDVPSPPDVVYARVADPTHVIQILKRPHQLLFQSVAVPKETVSKAIAAIKAGGKAEDALLPPLAPIDIKTQTSVTFPPANGAVWAIKPSAPTNLKQNIPPFFSIHPSPQMVAAQQQDTAASQNVQASALFFSSREAHQILVEYSATGAGQVATPFGRTGVWLERYDLNSGSVTGDFACPPQLECLDFSASGKSMVCRGGSDIDRIDVYRGDSNSFKPLVSFRPYAELGASKTVAVPPKVVAASDEKTSRSIEKAALVDDTHLLTLSGAGKVVLWELPAARAVWTATLGSHSSVLALSPDRRLACVGSLILFDPMTGKALGRLPDAQLASGAAFSPDGQQLVAMAGTVWQGLLQVFDLKTGQMLSEAPTRQLSSSAGATPAFMSPGFVLLDNGDLMSSEKKAVIWHYGTRGAGFGGSLRHGAVLPYDRAFFIAPREGKIPASVVNVALPHDAARAGAADLRIQDLFVWAPGMKLKLNLSVSGDEEFREQQATEWTRRLTAQGVKVTPDATNVLSARTFVLSGDPNKYFVGRDFFTITPHVDGYEISLTVNGVEAWKTALTTFPKNGFSVPMVSLIRKKGETLQQAADRSYPVPTSASVIVLPPTYIARDRKIESSEIGPRGIETTPIAR